MAVLFDGKAGVVEADQAAGVSGGVGLLQVDGAKGDAGFGREQKLVVRRERAKAKSWWLAPWNGSKQSGPRVGAGR